MSEDLKQKWQEIIRNQDSSGLTIKSYCDEMGVGVASFYKWKKRFKDETPEQISFVPAIIETKRNEPITVSVGNATIELKKSFDEELFLKVLSTLSKC